MHTGCGVQVSTSDNATPGSTASLPTAGEHDASGMGGIRSILTYQPRHRAVIAAVGRNGTIRLWDPIAEQILHSLDIEGPITACDGVGRWLAIGTTRGVSLLQFNGPPSKTR